LATYGSGTEDFSLLLYFAMKKINLLTTLLFFFMLLAMWYPKNVVNQNDRIIF